MESCNIRMSFIEIVQIEVVDFAFFGEREIAIIILCQLASFDLVVMATCNVAKGQTA